MLKKYSSEISTFMRYFREADGDDKVSVTVAPRENRGTDYSDDATRVNVPPRQNRGTDYGADNAEEQDTEDTPETQDAQNDDNADTNDNDDPAPADDDGTDYGADDEDTGDDEAADEGGEDDDNQDEEDPEPDTGDGGTDYSSDDGDAEDNNDSESSGSGDTEETDENKDEKLKKYHMYTRFVHLYNILDSMIEKCRDVVKPDAIQNAIIKTVINNLSDLYDNMFDFMTIKYKSSTYVQILFYYETVISVIKLNFELLRNNRINLKQ